MEYDDLLGTIWDNLPIIAAIILTVMFGVACYLKKPVKAIVLFISLVFAVYFGVI